jgi:ComF family protein
MSLGDRVDNKDNLDVRELAPHRDKLASRIGAKAKTFSAFLLDVLMPPVCLGCETRLDAHDALCPACWRTIDFIRPPLCDRLGIPMPYDTGGEMISAAAAAAPPDYDRARAVARYDGLMRDLIHDFKFRDTHDARKLFGKWMGEAGRSLIAECDVLVPVPLARWRLLTRRFNQSQILAREVAALSGKPVASFGLIRVRATKSQVGLSRNERRRNVAGAFAVPQAQRANVAGKAVLLIDDVVTTGATASSAARALKKAGAARVDVLALALAGDTGAIP